MFKNLSLGTLGNTVARVVGGGFGGQLLTGALGVRSGAGSGILGNIAGSGVGSIVVMAIVGLIKKFLKDK